jgi:hypothetical protein
MVLLLLVLVLLNRLGSVERAKARAEDRSLDTGPLRGLVVGDEVAYGLGIALHGSRTGQQSGTEFRTTERLRCGSGADKGRGHGPASIRGLVGSALRVEVHNTQNSALQPLQTGRRQGDKESGESGKSGDKEKKTQQTTGARAARDEQRIEASCRKRGAFSVLPRSVWDCRAKTPDGTEHIGLGAYRTARVVEHNRRYFCLFFCFRSRCAQTRVGASTARLGWGPVAMSYTLLVA